MKWDKVRLKDVSILVGGYAFKSSNMTDNCLPNYRPVIKIGNVSISGKLDLSSVQYHKYSKDLEGYSIKVGDVLIAMTGATVGKVSISSYNDLLLNQRVGLIRPKKDVITERYLHHALCNSVFYKYCQYTAGGGAQGNISPNQILEYSIPLPPLHIQEQITDTLDKADALRRKDQELLTKYDELAKVIFYDMFGEPNTNPKKIDSDILKNVCSFKGGKAWKNSELSSEGFPIIRISNLHKPNFKLWRTESTVDEKYLIKNGDLLFSWAGVQSSIDVYIYEDCDAMLNQHIYNLIPKNPQISRKFIYFNILLQLNKLRSNLGGGVGQFHMKKKDIEDIRILLPTLLEQEKF